MHTDYEENRDSQVRCKAFLFPAINPETASLPIYVNHSYSSLPIRQLV